MTNERRQAWERWLGIFFLLVIGACAVLVALRSPGLITFWPFTAGEFVQLITPLFLVSLFIERALEVFLTAWRAEGSAKLKKDIEIAQKGGAGAEPKETELITFTSGTQRMAFLGGVTMGVLVAALGVRGLGMFVDPAVFDALPSTQQSLFNTADVLLTGALLGGGADGLHKVVSVFTNFMDTTAKKVKTP